MGEAFSSHSVRAGPRPVGALASPTGFCRLGEEDGSRTQDPRMSRDALAGAPRTLDAIQSPGRVHWVFDPSKKYDLFSLLEDELCPPKRYVEALTLYL